MSKTRPAGTKYQFESLLLTAAASAKADMSFRQQCHVITLCLCMPVTALTKHRQCFDLRSKTVTRLNSRAHCKTKDILHIFTPLLHFIFPGCRHSSFRHYVTWIDTTQ